MSTPPPSGNDGGFNSESELEPNAALNHESELPIEVPGASSSSENEGPPADPTPLDMVKRYALPVIFVVAVFAMYFKGGPQDSEAMLAGGEVPSLQGEVMGTTFQVKVADLNTTDTNGTQLLWDQAVQAMELVNDSMSTYKADSELSLLNAWTELEPMEITSNDLMEVLKGAEEVYQASNGAFDPTVGPLVDLWGFGPAGEISESPSDEALSEILPTIGLKQLELIPEPLSVLKQRPDLRVDLSAIAKGYAVDQVAQRIESLGYGSWMVEIGGEVRAHGHNAEGVPWKVGVENPNPNDENRVWLVVPLVDRALATSGDYRNQVQLDGRWVSHTIDPTSGKPIDHGLASVSVLHESCMKADAWATALTVVGTEKGLELAEVNGLAALFIQREPDGSLVEHETGSWTAYMAEHAPPADATQ